MKTNELFDLTHTLAAEYLKGFEFPWAALAGLKDFIIELGKTLDSNSYEEVSTDVWVHKSAKVAATAHLGAPCIVGANSEVRHCAFVRGGALIGCGCVVGNATELKNVILFDGVQVPHYNYVGDSILGYKAHMGAGSITSNVKSDKMPVAVKGEGIEIKTGLKKLGALLGDFTEIGCNSVLNPGTVTGRNVTVYPLSCVRGIIPENSILKTGGKVVKKRI